MRLEKILEANVAEKLKADPRLAKFIAINWNTDGTLPPYVVAKLGPRPSEQKIVQAWSDMLDRVMSTSNYGDLSGGKFDLWVARQYANGHANWEDISGEAADTLGKWHALNIRSLLEPRDQDFNRFKNIEDIHKAMRKYSSQLDRIKNHEMIERHKREKSETVLIDNDRFYVMIPYNYGSCYTFNNAEGIQANFCTGGSNGLSWSRRYMPDGPVIMLADKTNLENVDGKWQMHAATNQLVNAHQENRHSLRLNDMKFASLFPGLMKEIGKEMNKKANEIREKSKASEFIESEYDIPHEVLNLGRTFPISWASGDAEDENPPEQQQNLLEKKVTKTRLDPKCWKGKKIGNPKTKVKGGVRVNNCVPMEETVKSAIARSALGLNETEEAAKKEYRVKAIVQSLGAARKNYIIRVSASDEQQAITIANKKARAFGTLISSKLVDEE